MEGLPTENTARAQKAADFNTTKKDSAEVA